MPNEKNKSKRLIGLFLLGIILSNYPIISLFNLKVMLFGFPLLYLYMFSIWTLIIVFNILITESGSKFKTHNAPQKPGQIAS